ncbi:dihydrolipoamide acetyltransferase family protein [Microbulbifer hainanensis]|uniref:dihydrolipoamide acetyltransferase family protein n=1 Tax=Microbulbifer hainanensis TaxID=2735675 RepID=UPI001865F674|nr:dihydrolipoamide acetyltransferase family protein [Microbulbifer hainanensis]
MKIFKLPDLGEGLPDAVIREWHVAEGEHVAAHASLVTVETAKALVEVPAPRSGIVEKLYVQEGDTVEVGEPLVAFADVETAEAGAAEAPPAKSDQTKTEPADSGTVVGKIQSSGQVLDAEIAPTGIAQRPATPSVRALARRLGVNLSALRPAGERFTAAEIRAAAGAAPAKPGRPAQKSGAAMSPARRAMALAMTRARDQVAPMTLCDVVDIGRWWRREGATLRLIRAIQRACTAEPNLNALYESDQLSPTPSINIGLAVDSPRGLFVPVLKDVASRDDGDLLEQVEAFKWQASESGIAQEDLKGATILLSNFGGMAGRFATPVVMPPTVAIVGAGRTYDGVIGVDGEPAVRPLLPLSISADHRAVTGGELARFLKVMMEALSA